MFFSLDNREGVVVGCHSCKVDKPVQRRTTIHIGKGEGGNVHGEGGVEQDGEAEQEESQ